MKLINLTPHPIDFIGKDYQIITLMATGTVARVEEKEKLVGEVKVLTVDIPVYETTYGAIKNLPPMEQDTGYIVSTPVRLACPERPDLYSPYEFIRDAAGRITGAGALVKNQEVKCEAGPNEAEPDNKKLWLCKDCGSAQFIISMETRGYMNFTSSNPAKEAIEMLTQGIWPLYKCDNCGNKGVDLEDIAEYREVE